MIYEVRQNYEGKFYYQILGDTVGPFDTENEAREEGAAALKLVEGQNTIHQQPQHERPPCDKEISRVVRDNWFNRGYKFCPHCGRSIVRVR